MSAAEPPSLDELRRLALTRATGELVCATPSVEVHVHLQAGRVAWATSSAARFAFGRYVLERCDLDAQAFRELVLECQREGKPLGETLVGWGVATEEAVREALRLQVVDALDTLREAGPAQTVFLRRGVGYRRYDAALTFTLDEVCRAPRRRRASQPRMPRGSTRPAPARLDQRLSTLLREEPDVRWIEHHRGGDVVARLPDGDAPIGIHEAAEGLFHGDLHFVAVRGLDVNVVGVELGPGAGVAWCGVDPDVVLDSMVTVVRERLARAATGRATDAVPVGPLAVASDHGLPPALLEELLAGTPALWGVVMVDHAGVASCLAHREAVDAAAVERRIAPLCRFLRRVREVVAGDDAVALPRASMLAATRGGWLFGGELLDETRRELWLLVDPSAGAGMGWAVLAALLRRTSLTSREARRSIETNRNT